MQLDVVAFGAPVMGVFRTIVDEQDDPRTRNVVEEDIEECLGFAVQPLQVFENELERLVEAFADQQTCNGFERALAPDGSVHGRQCRAGLDGPKQIEQVGQIVFQRPLQGE
ncbi:hypothetical protein PTE30175_05629 [Pandoraea terrae]|uniref:Uncharacterized protein n=1 Tax=Pandoraea terrae TaxID=1537710 RepID=A0A5E4ZEJ4_9BURK|nr:hypothetical protein PTE30175_05629 [Pandoraea terrae]